MADVEKGQMATPTAAAPAVNASNGEHPFNHATFDASFARQAAIQGLGIRKIANPGPLGLYAFALTTFVLSLYNVQARHIAHPNVVVGLAVAMGGLSQLLAGQWEFVAGNTFGATAFTSYGAFWISYALILIPGSGIGAAYPSMTEFDNAVGIYLMAWFIITFLFFIASLRTHLAFNLLFGFLFVTFLLLGAGSLTGSSAVTKAGGAFGIVTAMVAFYTGSSILFTREDSGLYLPRGFYHTNNL
ncbi:hypothetical protein Clacol_003183 [Clathrus columnatus]|uniref:Uncharacterized protein n=1 Tax=Clathrus columnatus TaxID=1419009 RepID=A0AAV5A5N6_9AGAM|nr:hypothetical protein Clacol_003183 [Clathrus columnatus]